MSKILIDIGHPAHVHLFKNAASALQKTGKEILFTTRDKEITVDLLRYYNFPFICFGKHYKSFKGKIWGLLKYDSMMISTGLKFKPDLFLSHGSFYAAHAAFFLNKPHISMEDTGNKEQVYLYKPFTVAILTPDTFDKDNYGNKQIKYNGYHELAYLHPAYFKPNKKILNDLQVSDNEKYVLIRFVSWGASHDRGKVGLTLEDKKNIVTTAAKFARVFISSEGELPPDLIKYKINVPPYKMHDVLAFSSLYIGEGATMAVESALLGSPSIYINSISFNQLDDLDQNYHLIKVYKNFVGVESKIVEILSDNQSKKMCLKNLNDLLMKKINVTNFLVWFIENYPTSIQTMKNNPDYQFNFR